MILKLLKRPFTFLSLGLGGFCGCQAHLASLHNTRQPEIVCEELRTEITDLKHLLHATEIEVQILEERLEKLPSLNELAGLQKKLGILEKKQEKVLADMEALATHANQTTASLSQYRDRIQEIESKESRTIAPKSSPTADRSIHRVKAGDTLEKIARQHHTTLAKIKQANQLEGDKIVIGQELIIPHE
jgi:LysM repeat protein